MIIFFQLLKLNLNMSSIYDFYGKRHIIHVRSYDYYGWGCIVCRWTYNKITGSYSYYQYYQPYQFYPCQYPCSYSNQDYSDNNSNRIIDHLNDPVDSKEYEAINSTQPANTINSLEKKEENQHDTQTRNANYILPLESQGNINNSHEMDNQSEQNNLNTTDKEFSNEPVRPLSQEDKYRANIARQNFEIESSGKYKIVPSELITNSNHEQIANSLGETTHKGTRVYVNNLSSIKAAINSHKHGLNDKICILNFADAYKPGGGYLNGRNSQEETICRQTLLYPTIKNSSMYTLNSKDKKPENSDIMQYSQDVYVIRDDDYELIDEPFLINVISSSAVDNHEEYVPEANEIMEERIRKIIRLAAFKQNDVLILGAFGCGVFKNDTYQICQIFKKILIEEGMKDYFKNVIFPIITLGNTFKMYKAAFSPK